MPESILRSGNLKIVLTFKGIPVKIELSGFIFPTKKLELFCIFFSSFPLSLGLLTVRAAQASLLQTALL